jgi:hypothetical protein
MLPTCKRLKAQRWRRASLPSFGKCPIWSRCWKNGRRPEGPPHKDNEPRLGEQTGKSTYRLCPISDNLAGDGRVTPYAMRRHPQPISVKGTDMEVVFIGISGFTYKYIEAIIGHGRLWLPYPGNYVFVRLTDVVIPLYFGECENFGRRGMPPAHERWAEAVSDYGATHVLSHLALGSDSARRSEERDLIASYNPPMNVQHRTNQPGFAAGALSAGIAGFGSPRRRGIV